MLQSTRSNELDAVEVGAKKTCWVATLDIGLPQAARNERIRKPTTRKKKNLSLRMASAFLTGSYDHCYDKNRITHIHSKSIVQ